ncbi:hypothetical protein AEM51_01065 [Bacteroidetes bacterium UKL13-3]|nr:hypothetical protein AEM51_01065 [Bacteroidetes bacterium UKL13-3]HCP92703.1 hypothetical protein [Bacteroidota bacterium]
MKTPLQGITKASSLFNLLVLTIFMLCGIKGNAQNISNYAVSRNTGITYSSISGTGTSVTAWRNGTSTDDNLSENQPIGFPFIYMGQVLTGFRISTNGFLTFNTTTTAVGGGMGAYGYANLQFNTTAGTVNTLAPFHDDLQTAANSSTLTDLNNSMKYQTTGTAGTRILTVEWINMQDFSGTSTSSFNWQIKLYEATGVIEFIYSTFTLANSGPLTFMSYSLGINGPTLSATPTASELLNQQTVNTATFSNVASNALGGANPANMPTALSSITFTPPTTTTTLTAPTNILFSNITGSSMKVDWTDNATGEFGYAVLVSSNGGTTYNLAANLPANTQTATISGLLPGISYMVQVVAVDLAATSSPLIGTQSTLPPANVLTTATGGLWSNPLTWAGGGIPTVFDTVIVASGATLTIDIAATIAKVQLNNNSTLFLNNTLVDSSDLIIGTGAVFNGFFGTTGRQLTVRGSITNNGTLNMAMPGGILLLNGVIAQTMSGAGTYGIIPTLTLNNLNGLTLNNNITVGAALNLTNGVIGGSGTLTMGNATFSPTFTMTSTGGRITSTVVSGLTGILPGNATFTYNAPTPVASITTGNELNITAPTNMNIVFNAIGGGNYTLGSNISANNITFNDTVDVDAFNATVNGIATFNATAFVTGTNTFTMGPNATLVTSNLLGINALALTGSVRTGIRNYSSTGNYTFNGATGQVTGDGLPATLTGGTVTISTTGGTLLSQSTVFNNLTLTTNLLLGTNTVTINGNGIFGTLAITGAGLFNAGPGSRLFLSSTAAGGVLQATGTNGNIQNTGGRTYNPGLDIVLGGSAVATGNDFPATGIDSLVLNQTTAAVLTAATSANTLLISSTGRLTTTAINSLTILGTQASNVARTSTGYIDGPFTRTIGVGAAGSFMFPLGVGATGNLGMDIINPVVTGSPVTLTAIARSLATGGSAGTGLTALTNTRYWAITPVSGGTLTSVGNIRLFESTATTLGNTSKKIGFSIGATASTYNSIGGQLDSANVNILSSLTVPAFGTGSDSTFLVLGNGTASGVFTGGTYTVGPTGTYSSLTAAIAAINERTSLSSPVVLEFQATYNPNVEAYPIVLRATLPTTSTNRITIRPSSGVSSAINFDGSIFTSTALIDFNGAKNVIIDGRPGGTGTNRFIAFNQRNIGTFPTIRFINDAQNDTLRFISVSGQNTSTASGVIFISNTTTTTPAGGNNNLAISNCNINGLSNTANCIFGSGSALPADNKNVTISNNNIFDFFLNGSSPTGLIAGAGSSNWTIDANNFYQTATRNSLSIPAMTIATNFRAIQLNNTATNANFTVTNNRVGGNIPGIAGSVFILGDSVSNLGHLFRPFDFANAGTTSTPNSVQGNVISDITLYTNGTDNFTGIGALQTGIYNVGNISPNIVGSTTTNGSIKIFQRTSSAGTARGFHFTATGGGSMNNNVVSGIDLMIQGAQATGGSISFNGIVVGATFLNSVTISGNTFGSTTLANSIQGLAASLGAVGINGVQLTGATGAAITASNNTIQNLSSFSTAFTSANTVKGIFVTGASSISTTVSGNTIRDLRCDAANNLTDATASVVGIANTTSGTGTQTTSNNTIHSLRSTYNGPVANVAQGIFYNSTNTSGLSRVERNVIHSLETGASNNFTIQAGLNLGASATTVQVVNNFVRLGVNVNGTTNNANATFNGIWKQNTTNTTIVHNTVYIAGNPAATDTFGLSAAFNKTASATVDTVMNNIFMNARSNASGTGQHYAMWLNNTTGYRGDANLTFVNGTGGVLFRNGFTRVTSLQTWRNLQKPFGISSAVANPLFNAGITNGAATINFSLNASSPASTAAITLSYITVDQGGNTRPANRAIGSFDVGLSALTAANDVYVPRFTFTPTGNRAAANAVFANINVTDIGSGVPTSGANAPRLWYRNATTASPWTSVAPTSFTGTGNNATFSYTFNYTPIGGTPAPGNVIYYYFTAQDLATAPNIWYSQYSAIDPIHSDVNTQTTPPTLVDSFLIVTPLPTTINIPVDYPNLTGTTGLFNALNNSALVGNTTVTITADVNETGANQLNNAGLGGFRLTIQPDATLRTLWGNSTTSLIRLNGVSNVIIDGGPSKNLRILDSIGATTSATVGATIEFLGGCTNDTLVNCIIEGNGSATARGTITFGAGNNSNILIANNEIRAANNDTLRRPAIGIFSNNVNNSNITIGGTANRPGGNNIYDFTSNGINLSNVGNNITIGSLTASSNGNSVYNTDTITGSITYVSIGVGNNHIVANNKVYQTSGIHTSTVVGFSITGSGTGHTITRNHFGGAAMDRSGRPLMSTGGQVTGFSVASGNIVVTTIDSNYASNFGSTTSGVFGISSSSGLVNITKNMLGFGVNVYDTIRNGSDNGIINVSGGTNVLIEDNRIGNISYINAAGDRTSGITINGTITSLAIRNNIIKDINGNSTTTSLTSTFRNAGIALIAVNNNILVEGNSIFNINNTNTGTTALLSSGIFATSDIRNSTFRRNRIFNIGSSGTGTAASAPLVSGVHLASSTANGNTFINNQISVGNGTTGETVVMGIRDDITSGTNNYINNSIFINGRIISGSNNSFGVFRSAAGTINVTNNLIYNKRIANGTGRSFAVGSTNAITSANLNYNTLIVNDTSAIAQLLTVNQGWAAMNTLYTTTYNTNWAERTSLVAAEALFTDTLVGNLGINSANPEAWYVHGKGIRIIGQTGDFNTATGVRSGAINTGAVDIGSVEFIPTSLPPIAFADKAPAATDSTQFFFASRMIGKAVWGGVGSLPSSVDVRYYSGVNPSNTLVGSTFMNAYWDIAQTGGSGFTYDLTLMQDSAVLGTVVNPSNLGIARYAGTGTNWSRFNPTVSNNITGFMNALSVNAVGIFTGTDITNNPLPVKLISFTANVESTDVLVSWTTASEQNNKGFEVERSVDGRTFEFAGFVEGAGNSNQTLNYSLLDNEAFAKTNANILYYRLKQVDVDGNESYSNIVMVSSNTENTNGLSVYPNPFTTDYTVSLTATTDAKATVELFDLQGKQVNVQSKEITKGFNVLQVTNVEALHTGIYFVKVTINGETQVMKLVKN